MRLDLPADKRHAPPFPILNPSVCVWVATPVVTSHPTAIQMVCVECVQEVASCEVIITVDLVIATPHTLTQLQNNSFP